MKGSIDYFRKVREICKESKGDCKKCPLGNKKKVQDNRCPRLLSPDTLTDDKILEMVKL